MAAPRLSRAEREALRFRKRRWLLLRGRGLVGDVEIEGVDTFGRRLPLSAPQRPTPRTLRLNAQRSPKAAQASMVHCCGYGVLRLARWLLWAHGPGAVFVTWDEETREHLPADGGAAFLAAAHGDDEVDSQVSVMRWLWGLRMDEASGVAVTVADHMLEFPLFSAAVHGGPSSVGALRFLFEEVVWARAWRAWT